MLLAMAAAFASPVNPAKSVTLAFVGSGDVALHLDASAGVTGSGPVTAWADQSGNGFNFGSVVNTPTLVTGAMNGLDVIRFSPAGGNDSFNNQFGAALNTYLGSNPLTIFMVTQGTLPETGLDTTGGLNGFFVGNAGNSNMLRTRFDGMNHTGVGGVNLTPTGSGSVVTFQLNFLDDPGTGPVTNVTSWRSWSFAASGATDTGLFYAGSLSIPTWDTAGFGFMRIGEADGVGFTGDMAEFVIYRGALNDADRTLIEQQLAAAYGVTPEPSRVVFLLLGLSAALFRFTRRRAA